MTSSLKNYYVKHSIEWHVAVAIDPSKYPDHDDEDLADLAERTAGSWCDDQHHESWTYRKNNPDFIRVVDEDSHDGYVHITPIDEDGLEYKTYKVND